MEGQEVQMRTGRREASKKMGRDACRKVAPSLGKTLCGFESAYVMRITLEAHGKQDLDVGRQSAALR